MYKLIIIIIIIIIRFVKRQNVKRLAILSAKMTTKMTIKIPPFFSTFADLNPQSDHLCSALMSAYLSPRNYFAREFVHY